MTTDNIEITQLHNEQPIARELATCGQQEDQINGMSHQLSMHDPYTDTAIVNQATYMVHSDHWKVRKKNEKPYS